MRLRVLALDYDGTIAEDGALHPEVRGAIEHVRARGLVVVLVTGRILDDLRRLVGSLELFDAVVAENGAVLAFPAAGRSTPTAAAPPAAFLAELARRGIPAVAGRCVVEFDASAAQRVLDVIRTLELPLTLHFNRSRLMALPQAVSKATGLREALRIMRLSPHNAIALGDAENDHELLSVCEIGAAVAWGSEALKAVADLVVDGGGPASVAGWLRSAAATDRILPPPPGRRRLLLGRDPAGAPVSLAVRGRNVLIAGDPRSGKSWIAGLLCEQLITQQYCTCVLDPEGDYVELENLPGVVPMGGDEPPPSMHELTRTLRHADVSPVLDLSRLGPREKRDYVASALRLLTDLRRTTGLPHRIVVDEAHYFLHDPEQAHVLDPELLGYTLVTYRVTGIHPDVLASAEVVVVTRETDPEQARLLHRTFRGTGDPAAWQRTLASLETDEAALLPVSEEAGGVLRRFRIAPRLTRHVRHRHKYLDVPVAGAAAFRFVLDDGRPGPVAHSLHELAAVLERTPLHQIDGHVRRGDFSRWIADVVADAALADTVRDLEEKHRLGTMLDFNGAVIHAIHERYGKGEPLI